MRIIIFLAVLTPFMSVLSGCYNDAFLDAIHEEEDFIAPFDVVLTHELLKRTVYFEISDTGSSSSIASGDDASYNNTPNAIDLENQDDVYNNDDVVVDHVTGLIWTKCTMVSDGVADTSNTCAGSSSSSTLEWSKAVSTCKNLTYANHKDWRLPRLPELLTIVDYGFHPAIDSAVFPNTQTSLVVATENVGYWTYSSKLFVDDNYNTAEYAWIVFHQGGGFWNLSIANYKLKLKSDLSFEKQFVRCVRGGAADSDDIDF